ncbi:site-2 protease family protein, partial [Patescibacteria group bacterium]|nr:site-2 protease family protein [Patescibacteria group bacterium]
EFGFGMPPRIWGKKKGETIYSINAIAFGGFVRMLGEDTLDPKKAKNKRSFASKSMRDRFLVIIAGVVMNFFLAWLLLTIGFSVGMQPLYTADDILPAIKDGGIVVQEGLEIKNVEQGSEALALGFVSGDIVYALNGKELDYSGFAFLEDSSDAVYGILRDGSFVTLRVEGVSENLEDMGVEFSAPVALPRLRVLELENFGPYYDAGVREGDYILSVNGEEVFVSQDYEQVLLAEGIIDLRIYRNGETLQLQLGYGLEDQMVISQVFEGNPAYEAGIMEGDKLISINGQAVDSLEVLAELMAGFSSGENEYLVERGGQIISYSIKPEEGMVGIIVTPMLSFGGSPEINFITSDLIASVVEIKDEKYPIYKAPLVAITETFRLAKKTGVMFVDLVAGLLNGEDVPDTVAGPVGIAQMTHVFVQEGFIPLLRFMAILSLSLAVINILPFPALDGGRLLFIFLEFVLGRPVNPKWEAHIHGLGYVLILLLILVVTYSDIARLISG